MAADLGTVGTALSRSAPPPAPPPDSTDSPDDPKAVPAEAAAGVRDVLGRNKEQIRALQGRLQEVDRRSDALQPPVMVKAPPPPETHDTPIADRWGSVAMMLAGFGGLLTRQPLTASLNAMAAVNHAFNEGDAARAKSAFDTWKVENENAIKMNDFHVKAYDGAIRKIATDRNGALAEIRATAAALKDDVVIQLLDSGQTDRALQMLGARATGAGQFSERAEMVAAHTELKLAYRRAHPNATPEELARVDLEILKNKDPEAPEKPEGPGVAENQRQERIAADDFQTQFGRAADPKNPQDRVQLDRLIEAKKLDIARETSGAHTAGAAAAKPETGAQIATQEDRTRAGALFKQAYGHAYDPSTATDEETAKWPDFLDAAAKTRVTQRAADKPETLAAMDANEVRRLMRDEGLSETDARKRVQTERTPDKPLSAAAAESARMVTLATDAVQKATGRPIDPNNPDDKVALARETENQKVIHAEAAAAARLKATLAVHDAHDALDPETVKAEAEYLRNTGKMSALGLGSSIARKQILEERAKELREEGGSIAGDIARQSDIHSLQQSLTTLARSKSAISNFEATARKEADLTASLAPKGIGSGVPLINRWIQGGRRALEGDPDVVSFHAALTSFKNEYARIMSSPTATGGQTTDAARSEADTLINTEMSYEGVMAAIHTMKIGMDNRISSINEEYDATKNRIASLGGEIGHGAPPVPGARKAPDGNWYVDDPNKPGRHLRVDP